MRVPGLFLYKYDFLLQFGLKFNPYFSRRINILNRTYFPISVYMTIFLN
nr:MAG TPA: hypothetical protein [Caudoviricetes sp.]